MGSRINNVIVLKCTPDSFYRMWLEMLTPFHNLANREKDVAARILLQWSKLCDSVEDPTVREEIMWSKKSKLDIRNSLGMSSPFFQSVLRKLRANGVLVDGDRINPRYIPHLKKDDNGFVLAVMFDFSSTTNPGKPANEAAKD